MLSWINLPKAPHSRFLFLDRDGVINEDRPDYIRHWKEYRFYPDALDALRWLREHCVNVILISNQSALNRGITGWKDFWEIHTRMIRRIEEAGGEILAAFYCPHHPDEKCDCRKPSPGMILAAGKVYGIPLGDSHLIGDRHTDLLAASQAGCEWILLNRLTENGAQSRTGPESFQCSDKKFGNHGPYTNLVQAVTDIYGEKN